MTQTRLSNQELWPDRLPNHLLNRANELCEYLKNEDLTGKIMDCGEDNPLKRILQNRLNINIESRDWDFNYHHFLGFDYDAIFAFEVLEHIFNPLAFLESITDALKKNGTIYLSTPYQWPQVLKAVHHYHEIPEDRLMWLFDAAGLKVVDKTKLTIAGNWHEHINGIRPILRYFQKTRLYKLKVQ